jgi:phage baseplate assembly protein W
MSTKRGERLFNPEFGTDIERYLFEPCDDITSAKIYADIYGAIRKWDARVKLSNSQSTVIANPENHSYTIKLVFQVVGLGDTYFDSTYTLKGSEDS